MALIRCVLKHKQSELNLNDPSGRFHIARDFVPPSVSLSADIAAGSAANRMDGGELVGMKAENRRWSFGVHVTGDSEAEVRSGISLLDSFLRRGTPSDPVYVHVRGSEDFEHEPLWGQYGADLRYEIVFGIAGASRQYSYGFIREGELPECHVQLEIKPFALGLQQRLASALGGILEDHIGASDGISRGTIIPEATTNKFTNPIFGHSTWNTGWTMGTVAEYKNTDPEFITHGKASAKLVAGVTPQAVYQSINVGNTNTHQLSCYAKLPDKGAVSIAQIMMYYNGSSQTSSYEDCGDGRYRVSAEITGVASSVSAGVEVKPGHTVYVDGFQLEEKAYVTPVCHGDMLGCAWSGTAHASTSTRTAARLRLNESGTLENEGTIRIVVKTPYAHTEFSNDKYVFVADQSVAPGLRLYWDQSESKWVFREAINIATSAATSFAAGDILIFHCVYGAGFIILYLNSVNIAQYADYMPSDYDDYIYIGSDESLTSTSYPDFIFMDFTTFAASMSATEVANDYANILEHVEDDRRLSPIPYLWTKDGDDVVDNCDDSTRDNYCVIAGVPGTDKAKTEIKTSADTAFVKSGFWFARSKIPYDKFVFPTSQWYSDAQGTALATCSGGEYDQDTVTAATVVNTLTPDWPEEFTGQIYFFGRLAAAATDSAKVAPVFYFGSGGTAIIGDEKTLSLSTTFTWFYLGSMFVEYPGFVENSAKASLWGIQVDDVDGSVDFRNDFIMAINGEVLFSDGTVATGTMPLLTVEDATYRVTTSDTLLTKYPTKGDIIELEPEKYNFLWVFLAKDAESHTIADTMTFSSIKVTPRWALL